MNEKLFDQIRKMEILLKEKRRTIDKKIAQQKLLNKQLQKQSETSEFIQDYAIKQMLEQDSVIKLQLISQDGSMNYFDSSFQDQESITQSFAHMEVHQLYRNLYASDLNATKIRT